MFKYFPQQVGVMLSAASDGQACLYDAEKAVMGFRHTDIAADLFEKWKFPVALSQNVVYHHRPSAANDPANSITRSKHNIRFIKKPPLKYIF